MLGFKGPAQPSPTLGDALPGFASLGRSLYGPFASKEGSDAPAGFGNFDDLGGFGNVVGSLANV